MAIRKKKPKRKKTTKKKSKEILFTQKLNKAKEMLKLSFVTETLPCRDKQKNQIKDLIEDFLTSELPSGFGIYISGMPGTGKTSCVKMILRELDNKVKNQQIKKFLSISINAMKLASRQFIYSKIIEKITKDKMVSKNKSLKSLESILSGRRYSAEMKEKYNGRILIFVDELDRLTTKRQEILYNIFDWSSRFRKVRTMVVGVANTMDLPERMEPRIRSRLGMERIVFPPYKTNEIEKILRKKLDKLNVFDDFSLQFCSRKISSFSGDIRQAFALCSKAVEGCLKEAGRDEKIGVVDLKKSLVDLENGQLVNSMKTLPLYQKIFLSTLWKCSERDDKQRFELITIEEIYRSTCEKIGKKAISAEDVLEIVKSLERFGYVKLNINGGRENIDLLPMLNDVSYILEEDEICGKILG